MLRPANKSDATTSAAADNQFQQADSNSDSGSGSGKHSGSTSSEDDSKEEEDSSPVTVTKTKDAPAQAASSGSSSGHSWGDYTSYYAATNKTSNSFAGNVYTAFMNNWVAGGGTGATLSVYSPVTGGTYTMYCSGSSSSVTCSGGDNARVVIY